MKNISLGLVVKDTAARTVGLGLYSRGGQIGHSRHRCDASSELCCPGVKTWRTGDGPATRYTLWRVTASIMKVDLIIKKSDHNIINLVVTQKAFGITLTGNLERVLTYEFCERGNGVSVIIMA